MDGGGSGIEFWEIQDLVDWFFRADYARVRSVHVVTIGGDKFAGVLRAVALVYAEILYAQLADGHGHPAILIFVIVDAAYLAGFPTDGDYFEEIIFEN